MGQIVYFWINEYRNIKNQGFNFGSEYEYVTKITSNTIKITRRENKQYIPNLFTSEESSSILNISAIVGENGTGKSNFLDALKHALTGDRDYFKYILIFKTQKGEFYRANNLDKYSLKIPFPELKNHLASETIYYNPALDNKIYPITHDSNAWIDISTDWLLYRDSEEQKEIKPNISQIELFEAEEIERQLKLSNDDAFTSLLENRIKIPDEIEITSLSNDFPSVIDGINNNDVRNVPYNYRDYYDMFNDKVNVINDYASMEIKTQEKSNIINNVNHYRAKKCYAIFLNHLLKNLFYHFESTGDFLLLGKIQVDIDELKKLNFEDAVIKFIKNIDLINDTQIIVDFVIYTKKLISNGEIVSNSFNKVSWISPKKNIYKFIELKDSYLLQLNKFVKYSYPKSFTSYGWPAYLSTGEKAMLNLYSRFYSVESRIKERNETAKPPNILYVLIDEGELGFHLQWQKEYINDLINYLPETLRLNKLSREFIPRIQIVFTTHSTLSLSDIPSSHITYLKKNDGLAHVLNNDEKPTKSFGANVHSLMSDSFFLEHGLVGSFATKKINLIIKYIKSKELSESRLKYVKSVIEIIDEPLLKNKLVLMLDQHQGVYTELDRLQMKKIDIERRIVEIKNKS